MKKTKLKKKLNNGYLLVMCNPSSRLEGFARHQPKGQPKMRIIHQLQKHGRCIFDTYL